MTAAMAPPHTEPSMASGDAGATRAMLVVSFSVLLCSSIWFSGTAVVSTLGQRWSLSEAQTAWLTISVQLGFITGTFLYAFLSLADRFNARRVFLASALVGALFNASFAVFSTDLSTAIAFRFLSGVTLAGVYPVGMKIIASWFESGLGWRLGVMVGALTIGTASPYLIRSIGARYDWRLLVLTASVSSVAGGILMATAVSDGPYLKRRARFDGRMLLKVFKHREFRYTAFGYFGHMWELYAFWSLGSFYLASRLQATGQQDGATVALLSFLAVAAGGVGCVVGGRVSTIFGEQRVALVSLAISGSMCALSGLAFGLPIALLTAYVVVWGVFVVADSPQFSALAAKYCPPEYTGTALTVQNGVGFAVTILSIQLLPLLAAYVGWRWAMMFLSAGPVFGTYYIAQVGRKDRTA
jgi:MFS family permease